MSYLELLRQSKARRKESRGVGETSTVLQVSESGVPASAENLTKPDIEADNPNAQRLLQAGWKPKVSFGDRVIWQRPDTGFYRSEEAAICLLDLEGHRSSGRALKNKPMQS